MNRGMYDDEFEVPSPSPMALLAEDLAIDRDREIKAAYQAGRRDAWEDHRRASPRAPDAGRPTVAALVACTMALLAVECLLVALRVGGAYDWSWGWVLAPVWVPVTVATVAVTGVSIWLGALDERDAARGRRA